MKSLVKERLMQIREIFGKKSVIWDEYEKPTLSTVLDVIAKEFPGVPHNQLVLTADIDNDGRSVDAQAIIQPL